MWNTIDAAYPYRLRGTQQQTDNGLLWTPPSYRVNQAGGAPTTATLLSQGLALGYVNLHNRSGGAAVLGIGVRIPNRYWVAGQWTDAAGTPFADDTPDAQSTTASDFPLETLTGSDGYVIASRVPFNAISLNVGTASVDGSPVRAVRYSNTAGDGWTDFANLFVQDAATGQYSTGEQVAVWSPPTDWGRTQSGGLSGIPAGLYAVNVRATTAPTTTAGSATSMEIARLYLLTEAIADNGSLERAPAVGEIKMIPEGDALVALFSGTVNNQNTLTALVRTTS